MTDPQGIDPQETSAQLVIRVEDPTAQTWRIDCTTCGTLLGHGLRAGEIGGNVTAAIRHRCLMPANGHSSAH